MFKEFSYVFIIIIVHEIGHLIAAKICSWNFDKIEVYPFGGCVKLDDKINRSMKEELFILIAGPVMQILFFYVCYLFLNEGFISYRNFLIFKNYHYTLLIFNLLPIYPLDGGRILNIIINFFMPFKKSNKITICLSFLLIFSLLFFYKSLNFTLMGILLITELIVYFKRQDFLYNKMLLERFINPFKFKKMKIIKNKDNMYKDKRHIILYKDKYITEKEYLKERFKVR